jgi:hypothetical protein
LNRRDKNLLTLLAAAVAGAVLLVGRQQGVAPGFPLDDAWIHMVYGRALAGEWLPAYNPGVPAAGFTAPLWTLVVGVVHLLLGEVSTRAVVMGVMACGMLCHLATVRCAADLAARISGRRLAGAVAGASIAISAPLVVGALSGMETALCGLLLVLSARALWREHWAGAGFALAFAAAARPEAAVPALLMAGLGVRGASTPRRLLRLAVPSLVLGALIVAWDLHATGRPLPATFYFKAETSLLDLPSRLATAVADMLHRVPPLWYYAAWLALIGCFLRPVTSRRLLPLAGGLGFLVANLLVARPIDPDAFYHLRYVLPAVPLLAVALAVGAGRLGDPLPGRAANLPLQALLAVAVAGAVATHCQTAIRYHNDVRNINEVQVAMGRWIHANMPADARVAATDAGAVRYFGKRPVVDLMGLNTPEFRWDAAAYVTTHPVDVVAYMPAWVQPVERGRLNPYKSFSTRDYTVTSYPAMARQVIAGVPAEGDTVRVAFHGLRRFELDVRPWRPRGVTSSFRP